MLNIYKLSELVAIQPVNTTANPANVTTKASVARLSGKPRIYMLGLKFFPEHNLLKTTTKIMLYHNSIFTFQVFNILLYLCQQLAHINMLGQYRYFIIAD